MAEILTIGDELLRGEIVDSNKSFLSERLLGLDIETRFHASVRDDPEDMTDAFRRAARRSRIVIVSGGLGPTRDDLTIEVLAESFGRKLVVHEPSLEAIRSFFARFGRSMSENNAKQARFPEGGEPLPNPEGTAPGCMLREGDTVFFCLPGVPREMRRMMDEQVIPRIAAARPGSDVVRSRLLRTFGLGESNLDELLHDAVVEPGVILGFRTAFPDNYVRVLARASNVVEADRLLDGASAAVRERLGALVYAEGDQSLEEVVGARLRATGDRIAVAESCTGGLLAERLTAVPGSSDYFLGGVVAYSNAAKTALLGVPEALIETHGAVSQPVAEAMAQGARVRFGAELGVATTGISGPGGGSDDKPVGLVYVAVSDPHGTEATGFEFPFDRLRHRQLTSQVALDWVRRLILGVERVAPRYLRVQR